MILAVAYTRPATGEVFYRQELAGFQSRNSRSAEKPGPNRPAFPEGRVGLPDGEAIASRLTLIQLPGADAPPGMVETIA